MPLETGKTEGGFDTMKYAFDHATHPKQPGDLNMSNYKAKSVGSEFKATSAILPLIGIAGVAVGAYLLWSNRARIMSAVEQTGVPEKFSAGLDKVMDFANTQLGRTSASTTTTPSAESRAS
jgi:hypothetical protein